eukprot:COSAG05_NODE_6068_length_1028_cov_0.944026_1_plen_174_part_00
MPQVFQQPRGPTATSQFEHSSIPSTLKHLFNLSTFLTSRDAWAGSAAELLLEKPRAEDDCPMHLPDAPPPASPWAQPPGGSAAWDAEGQHRRQLTGPSELPRHCTPPAPRSPYGCDQPLSAPATQKQHNQAKVLSSVNGVAMPDMHALSRTEAAEWVGQEWDKFMMANQRWPA